MGVFSKVTCSGKIASKALDVFASQKQTLQNAIEEIELNKANRIILVESLETQIATLKDEIFRDSEEIGKLTVAKTKLDEVFN